MSVWIVVVRLAAVQEFHVKVKPKVRNVGPEVVLAKKCLMEEMFYTVLNNFNLYHFNVPCEFIHRAF